MTDSTENVEMINFKTWQKKQQQKTRFKIIKKQKIHDKNNISSHKNKKYTIRTIYPLIKTLNI